MSWADEDAKKERERCATLVSMRNRGATLIELQELSGWTLARMKRALEEGGAEPNERPGRRRDVELDANVRRLALKGLSMAEIGRRVERHRQQVFEVLERLFGEEDGLRESVAAARERRKR
jgi:hypothetical protein